MVTQPLDSVCIVMLGAIGDVVHTLPVVTALKRSSPSRRITWLLQPGPASLIQGHPDVDEVVVFHRRAGGTAFRDARRELAGRQFDITLAMQSYFKSALLTSFTRAPIKLGFDRKRSREFTWLFCNRHLPPREERHFQDQYLEFAEALGVEAKPLQWNLGPWPNEQEWRDEFAARFDRPVVSIVVGASRPEREWVAERWAPLCRALERDHGLSVVLVGGRSPRELAVEQSLMHGDIRATSTLGVPLRQLVSVLDASDLVITPNTGPMHMAVALDVPTISLHGFANPKRVGPYEKFHDLMIDAYGDPGEDYPVTPRNRPGRMPRISVEDVLAKVVTWERAYGPRKTARPRTGS